MTEKKEPIKYHLFCMISGDAFTAARSHAHTCSESCRMVLASIKKKSGQNSLFCVVCGSPFTSPEVKQTCSDVCAVAHWRIVNPGKAFPETLEVAPAEDEVTERISQVVGGGKFLERILGRNKRIVDGIKSQSPPLEEDNDDTDAEEKSDDDEKGSSS